MAPPLGDEARAVLDDAACGVLQTAPDGAILRANRLFCSWLGQPAEALVGKRRFQDLLTMGGRIFHQTHWAPLLQMQGSISEVKLELVHRDGSTVPVVVNALAHDRHHGRVHELAVFIARDRDKYERELVRSRKRLEEAVAQSNRLEAESKDRAVFAEQMIGIVSHDLRNPISGIQMGAALLARTELAGSQPSETRQNTVARIARAAQRATFLLADLLDFTQARLGKGIQVAVAAIDLHACVAGVVEDLALTYPGIVKHVPSGDGECVADPNRLAQLIGNLVSNAVAYGIADHPVTVRSIVATESFAVEVHNWGTPIPADRQASLFEPMTRGSGVPSSSRSIGLGLYIVNEIAKAHGGRATVSSSETEGTTFRVVCPRNLDRPVV